MEIKTKHNIGDKVFIMFQNKVIEITIGRIDIRIKDDEPVSIVYTSKEEYYEYSHITGDNERYNHIRSEAYVFGTKEELLKSL